MGVLDTVLIRAGVRLAMVLNEDLAAYRPGRSRPVQLQQGQVYADWQARAHAGEAATVEGMVETVHQTREGTSSANFGGPYPPQHVLGRAFSIIVALVAVFLLVDTLAFHGPPGS